jgi:hypothetical protein
MDQKALFDDTPLICGIALFGEDLSGFGIWVF